MAIIQIEILDEHVPRIVAAYKMRLAEGDAVDMENPTDAEVLAVLKRHWKQVTKKEVDAFEENAHRIEFSPTDLDIT